MLIRTPFLLLPFFLFLSIFQSCVPYVEEQLTDIDLDLQDSLLQQLYTFQDEQVTDSLITFFQHKDPTYRYAAALAFGSTKDEAALDSLVVLLKDPVEEVRVAAAYAIGQIGESTVEAQLIGAFEQGDTAKLYNKSNRAILEAVGKSSSDKYLAPLASITTYQPTDTALLEGQAWGLYRYALRDMTSSESTQRMIDLVTDGSYPNSVRVIAANYLYRAKNITIDSLEVPKIAQVATQVDDPRIRMALAVALGKSKSTTALNALVAHFPNETDYRVQTNIISALRNFDYGGVQALMLTALKDENIHVSQRAAQFFVTNGIGRDATFYWRTAKDTLPWQSQLKLYTAAQRHLPNYYSNYKNTINYELRRRFEDSKNTYEQAEIIRTMGEYGWNYRNIYELGFNHPELAVRTATVESLSKIINIEDFRAFFGLGYRRVRQELTNYLVEAIRTTDAGMTAVAAGALQQKKHDYPALIDSMQILDKTLAQLEMPTEIETYNELKKTIEVLNDRVVTPPTQVQFNHPIDWNLVQELGDRPRARIRTNQGTIVLELLTDVAPGTVANFAQLARDGFYNNKTFHRVVPNFVIQGGCPRGDGYGSLDYTIRSELPYLHYDHEGYVGMASAGNHTEGVQFFITHSPTPHLDGNYTIFAKVEEGMEFAHQIQVGDVIEEVTVQ
ncbi:MAG: peptidylprolyl isomerase [Saprospiraceae bacterium]